MKLQRDFRMRSRESRLKRCLLLKMRLFMQIYIFNILFSLLTAMLISQVQLQHKIKQESEQFRLWKASREKEVLQVYGFVEQLAYVSCGFLMDQATSFAILVICLSCKCSKNVHMVQSWCSVAYCLPIMWYFSIFVTCNFWSTTIMIQKTHFIAF